jgi:gas vesicle protein GvpK
VRLVLTLVRVLHELLERLAVRRMEGEQLTPRQIEDVGAALLKQALEIERLRQQFGFSDRDIALGFGLSDQTM